MHFDWLRVDTGEEETLYTVYFLGFTQECYEDTLAEWLRRCPAKAMGFPRKSSNLLGVEFLFFKIFSLPLQKLFLVRETEIHGKCVS